MGMEKGLYGVLGWMKEVIMFIMRIVGFLLVDREFLVKMKLDF